MVKVCCVPPGAPFPAEGLEFFRFFRTAGSERNYKKIKKKMGAGEFVLQ